MQKLFFINVYKLYVIETDIAATHWHLLLINIQWNIRSSINLNWWIILWFYVKLLGNIYYGLKENKNSW